MSRWFSGIPFRKVGEDVNETDSGIFCGFNLCQDCWMLTEFVSGGGSWPE